MLKQYSRNSVLVMVALVLAAATTHAASQWQSKREPIVITASRMEAEKLQDTVTFRGGVTLKKEALTLSSDRMIVFFDARSKGIREIEALGNVVARKDGRVAFSEKASYYSREEKIVLTGDARIIENENQLGGDRITLFMRDDRSIVEGGKILLYQDSEGTERRRGR